MLEVLIIGGGIAGIETACSLHETGVETLILEKENNIGGHVNNWDTLFPTKKHASEVIEYYTEQIQKKALTIYLNTYVTSIKKQSDGSFEVKTSKNITFTCKALVIATGYSLFNAERKEEYGYKLYENVITSADLEQKYKTNTGTFLSPTQQTLKRVAFIHCVGSRDEKSGNLYCSKLCCVTAVKQAIKLKQISPETEVYCLYIDLRMYGLGFEEMYREAQEKWNIQFIRGKLSEVAETTNNRLQLKAEDTLAGRPYKMEVDMLVLMIGMEASKSNKLFANSCNLSCHDNNFIELNNYHTSPNETNISGLFATGTSTAPLSVFDTINHAKSAALSVHKYLKNNI